MVLTTESTCLGLTTPVNDSTTYEPPKLDYSCNSGNVDSKWELLLEREVRPSEGPKGEAGKRALEIPQGGGNEQKNLLFAEEKGNSRVEVRWKVERREPGKSDLIKFHVVETDQNQFESVDYKMSFISEGSKNEFWNRDRTHVL